MPEGMEIIGSGKEKSTVYIAMVSLALIGIALVVSTWQILQRQREASMEHLELTAIAVLQAVDSSLRRGPMMGRGRFSTDTRDFFRDLEASGDILFVGLVDENGTRLGPDGDTPPHVELSPDAKNALQTGTRWQGIARYGEKRIYIAARRVQGGAIPERRPGTGAMTGPGPVIPHGERRHHRDDVADPRVSPPLFLTVAVDMDKHFAVYKGFRKTALFQTAYILAAALFLWALAMRFLSRRELAGKAVLLEEIQTRLIDNLPDGLLIADTAGRVTAANPAARDILTKPHSRNAQPERSGGAGNTDVAGSSGATRKLVGQHLVDILESLSPKVDSGRDTGWRQTSSGGKDLEIRVLPFHLKGEETPGGEAPSRMVIIRDRTRIRTLEKDLAEAEKLAAIGALAAGVAHEIRNPLSALRGFAQYFAKKLAGKQPEEEYAQTMVRESDRLNRVITDLLYLARPRDLAPVPTNLAGVCDEMAALLRFELREQGLDLSCGFAAATANADPDALKQALLNLLLNALEAVAATPDDGEAAPERGVALTAVPGEEKGKPGVWITVTDTGPGMNGEERAKACTPFFTTKKKGTGLGLALVQTIMQGHGGEIRITSPLPDGKRGCAVGLFFPDAPAPHAKTSDE